MLGYSPGCIKKNKVFIPTSYRLRSEQSVKSRNMGVDPSPPPFLDDSLYLIVDRSGGFLFLSV